MTNPLDAILDDLERQDFHEVFCPQCGWLDDYDQDGCCNTCGCVAIGEAVDAEVSLRKHLIAVARAAAATPHHYDCNSWYTKRTAGTLLQDCNCIKAEIDVALRALTATNQPTGSDSD